MVSVIEADPKMGVHVVGCGGQPNSDGVTQCDAAIMDGYGLKIGAVAALEGSVHTQYLLRS